MSNHYYPVQICSCFYFTVGSESTCRKALGTKNQLFGTPDWVLPKLVLFGSSSSQVHLKLAPFGMLQSWCSKFSKFILQRTHQKHYNLPGARWDLLESADDLELDEDSASEVMDGIELAQDLAEDKLNQGLAEDSGGNWDEGSALDKVGYKKTDEWMEFDEWEEMEQVGIKTQEELVAELEEMLGLDVHGNLWDLHTFCVIL
ncbi:hypothetical protein BDQ12DRAFT_665487 [Crucibulum laeve]|uniref:Uncharacterized protein n=1 Tax=Crucibulum laeve TaxID=68775 RepID=A0A5C3M2Z9_9AGAR|nr:hypothetical protein BDQ12DRAFT_665487 [Crucibulum laeve]